MLSRWLLVVGLAVIPGCVDDVSRVPSDADVASRDVASDSAVALDVSFEGQPDLWIGQFATGRLEAAETASYRVFVRAGEEVRFEAFVLAGDLGLTLSLVGEDGPLVGAPAALAGGDVGITYEIQASGEYDVVLRATQEDTEGAYLLRTRCVAGGCLGPPELSVPLRLVAINDFHGQLASLDNGTGGGARLAAEVGRVRGEVDHSLFVAAGDLIGASSFASAFFHDEPAFELMNLMGLDVTSVGNHEFDEGPAELLRLAQGGCHPVDGCRDDTPYGGAEFDILAANVRQSDGSTLFPSFVVRVVSGLPVGFIGMTLEGTPGVTVASAIEGLSFDDEVRTVNALIPRLRKMGVETIVVLIHEGGFQQGGVNGCDTMGGAIVAISSRIDDSVDVIFSGHTHATYNCVLGSKRVMSAGSLGRFVSLVDLVIAADSRDAVVQSARNLAVDGTITPDPAATALLAPYLAIVAEVTAARIGTLAGPLNRATDDTGETTLGLAFADAHLFATEASAGAQIAFMNRGGLRADLPGGDITFGQGFAAQPFENPLITVTISGQELQALLDRQFVGEDIFLLQPSSTLRYRVASVTPGSAALRIVPGSIMIDGLPLDPEAPYRVTANAFVADGDPILGAGDDRVIGLIDSAAFVDYLAASPSPLPVPLLDRVMRR